MMSFTKAKIVLKYKINGLSEHEMEGFIDQNTQLAFSEHSSVELLPRIDQ